MLPVVCVLQLAADGGLYICPSPGALPAVTEDEDAVDAGVVADLPFPGMTIRCNHCLLVRCEGCALAGWCADGFDAADAVTVLNALLSRIKPTIAVWTDEHTLRMVCEPELRAALQCTRIAAYSVSGGRLLVEAGCVFQLTGGSLFISHEEFHGKCCAELLPLLPLLLLLLRMMFCDWRVCCVCAAPSDSTSDADALRAVLRCADADTVQWDATGSGCIVWNVDRLQRLLSYTTLGGSDVLAEAGLRTLRFGNGASFVVLSSTCAPGVGCLWRLCCAVMLTDAVVWYRLACQARVWML